MRMTPTQVPSSKHDHFSSRNGASISVPLALAQVFCFSLDRDLPRGSRGNLRSIGLPGLAMEIAIGHSSFACAPEHARQDRLVGSTPLRTCTRIPSLRYDGPAGTSLPECWIDVTYETGFFLSSLESLSLGFSSWKWLAWHLVTWRFGGSNQRSRLLRTVLCLFLRSSKAIKVSILFRRAFSLPCDAPLCVSPRLGGSAHVFRGFHPRVCIPRVLSMLQGTDEEHLQDCLHLLPHPSHACDMLSTRATSRSGKMGKKRWSGWDGPRMSWIRKKRREK